ncbi:hypothetical protein LCGC14_2781650, partial [marine sediment metagenome]
DEFSFEIGEVIADRLEHVENIVTLNVPIPESTRKIIELNLKYDFRKEYIDSGGMGITVCDLLREDDANKRKVVEINNASRSYNREDNQRRILKEDLYSNLKRLMEQGKIKLLVDDEVKASLKSILAEHDPITGKLKIWGSYSHIAEGLIRMAWCVKDKGLKLWVHY